MDQSRTDRPRRARASRRTTSGQEASRNKLEVPPASTGSTMQTQELPPPQNFPACSPPNARTLPQFTFAFRRPIRLSSVIDYAQDTPTPTPAQLACLTVTNCSIDLGIDPLFEQTWYLRQVAIGDLASTMSLAPSEQLTLEFQSTQRKVFDKSVIDSVESIDPSESTTSDKEAVNITRASSKTENWHGDTTGSLSCGFASLSTSTGYSQSVTNSNQQVINHITETTKKSSHSLKSLHKVEVRGVSEGIVSNRMTRVLKNPYIDRTLSINVFQLVKHFLIQTALTEIRGALILRVNGLDFDNEFVIANVDFLQSALLDSTLIDDLATAIQGAKPLFLQDAQGAAVSIARRALHLLFDDTPIFHVDRKDGIDMNLISSSFNALVNGHFGDSGLGDALANHLEEPFVILNFFYELYKDTTTDASGNIAKVIDVDGDAAVRLAVTLAGDISKKLDTSYPDLTKDPANTDLRNIMDEAQFTEIFRRIPGFITMVSGMLSPLLDPANQEKQDLQTQAKAVYVLNRLLQHLNCNQNYYIQQYLRYIAEKTSNQAIVDFVQQILADPNVQNQLANVSVFALDVDRTFIDRQEIVIPSLNPLSIDDLFTLGQELNLPGVDSITAPVPAAIEVEVPCDGKHLEVAEGACPPLQNVPAQPTNLTASLQGLTLSFTG